MYNQNIVKLRKLISASISECKNVLIETGNDFDRAFDLLKSYKMEPIVRKTGASIDEAFMSYEQCKGDIEKAIERIEYIREAPPGRETEYFPGTYKIAKNRTKYINRMFKNLTKDIGTEEYDTFMTLLAGLRDNTLLQNYYGEDFVKIMMELLVKNQNSADSDEYNKKVNQEDEFDKNKYYRIVLIESIVNAINEDDNNNYKNKYDVDLDKLFDEYLILCNNSSAETGNLLNCLNDFIYHGINPTTIFIKVVEKFDNKERAVNILARLNNAEWGELPDRYSELLMEVKEASKILCRSHILSQFLVVVHPLCGKYASKSSILFSYFSYAGACYDWGWKRTGSIDRLVENKIISIREAMILEKLEILLLNEDDLNSVRIRELYYEFFQGKDPFDVIYTLPE